MNEIRRNGKMGFLISFLLPVALIVGLMWAFVKYGPLGVLEANFPPVENVFVKRVIFEPEQVILNVLNDGPENVTISQLFVNDAVWQFEMLPDHTLRPLESGQIRLIYPWVEGDPLTFTLLTGTGLTFEKKVGVSFLSPVVDSTYLKTFTLLGLYVGVIPVLLGLLWFPFLRRLKSGAYFFLLSLTVGLLIFLGFDALAESIELLGEVSNSMNGIGLLVIGFLLAILALGIVSYFTEYHVKKHGEDFKNLKWAYLISFGIGLHNLGEGLAIGSAYAIGEMTLGATLVVGFMAHNLTEGVAIVSPLTKTAIHRMRFLGHMVLMGLLAGVPTVIGSLVGGFAYSSAMAVLFLAIGAGAIFDVSFDIIYHMAAGRFKSLFTAQNVLGFLAGLLIMYGTGFLVLG